MKRWKAARGGGLVGIALALLLAAAPAAAQMSVSPEMAEQKARMLESFLASDRIGKARDAAPDAVEPLEREARLMLEDGRAALTAGQAAQAASLFDKGIHAVSRVMALASQKRKAARPKLDALRKRQREARSYLAVLQAAPELDAADAARADELKVQLDDAKTMIDEGDLASAEKLLSDVYADVVELVSAANKGRTTFVSLDFDTPEKEFAYERERNKSHHLLVKLALAERAEFQPGLSALAASLSSESERLREQAEAEAAEGRVVDAIATMERSTDRLMIILRAAGLILMQ